MKFTKKFLTALMVPLSMQIVCCNAETKKENEFIEKKDNDQSPMDPTKSYDFFMKKELYDLYEDILEEYNEQKLFSNMQEWEKDKADILEDLNEVKMYCNNPKCKAILEKLHKLLIICDEELKSEGTKDTINQLKNDILKDIKSL